jgi:hypothetical protein
MMQLLIIKRTPTPSTEEKIDQQNATVMYFSNEKSLALLSMELRRKFNASEEPWMKIPMQYPMTAVHVRVVSRHFFCRRSCSALVLQTSPGASSTRSLVVNMAFVCWCSTMAYDKSKCYQKQKQERALPVLSRSSCNPCSREVAMMSERFMLWWGRCEYCSSMMIAVEALSTHALKTVEWLRSFLDSFFSAHLFDHHFLVTLAMPLCALKPLYCTCTS